MSTKVISQYVRAWSFGGSTATLKIYASEPFRTSDGTFIRGGKIGTLNTAITDVTCAVSAGNITIPAVTLYVTDNSVDRPDVLYTAVLYDEDGTLRETFVENFPLPAAISNPTTWTALAIYGQTGEVLEAATYLNATEIDAVIAAIHDQLSNYASLAAAVAAIGSVRTDLYVDVDDTVAANLVVPSNINLVFSDGAIVSVNTGVTLTINNLSGPPSTKLFGGLGTVKLPNNPTLDICWWTGNDSTADHTAGIDGAFRSVTASNGGYIGLPNFRLRTSGGHSYPNFCTMTGGGYDPDGLTGPGFLLTSASATHVFKFVPYVKSVTLSGFSINVSASTLGSHKAIWMEGGDTSGAVMVKCEVAVLASGAVAGTQCFHYNNTGTNFYAEIIDLNRCWFSAPINTTAVYLANYNCSVSVHETIFALSVGATAVQYSTVGILHIWRCAFNGPSVLSTPHTEAVLETITGSITIGTAVLTGSRAFTTKDLGMRIVIGSKLDGYIKAIDENGKATMSANATATAASDSMTVYRYQSTKWTGGAEGCVKGTNAFVEVTIAECQDEGVNYFFQQDTDWYDGVINFRENVVQSFVKISGDCTINSYGNRYYSLFLEDSGSNTIEFNSFGDSVRPLILWNANWTDRSLTVPRIQGNISGATLVPVDLNNNIQSSKLAIHKPLEITVPTELAGIHDATKPMFGIGTYGTDDKPLFRAGVTGGPSNEWLYYTELQRNPANGEMAYSYTSPGFLGYRSYAFKDGPVRFTNAPIYTPTRPTAITTDQNDYSAADINGGGGVVTLTSTGGTHNISGWGFNPIQLTDGITRIVKNGNALGGDSITFTHEDAASTAAFRFQTSTAGTITLAPSQMAVMVYDSTRARWSLTAITGTPAASTIRCLEFDGTIHHNVSCGYFWDRSVSHGHFFWDAWIYVPSGASNGYFISDGYGGSHNLLAGVDITTGRVKFNGVIYSGGNVVWDAGDTFSVNEWHHVAVGWEGASIVTYIDGVPSSVLAFSGTRQTSGDPSEGELFIGGSDHNNFTGRIMNLRGFEGNWPFTALDTLNAFTPEHFFQNAYPADGASTPIGASFLMDFTVDSGIIIPDLSDGYFDGTKYVKHPGRRQVGAELTAFKYSQAGIQDTADLPQFVDADHVQPTYGGSVTTPPVGALVFDAFERADVTYAWNTTLGLGASPVGGTATQTQPMGILSGQVFTAVDTASNEARWDAGSPNVDVTIHRGTVVSQPVILLRYTDANNLTTAALNNGGDLRITETVAGVPSDITWAGAFGDTWLTMRVVMNGAAVTVYLDGVSIFTGTATRLTGNKVGFRIARTLDRVSSISVVPA